MDKVKKQEAEEKYLTQIKELSDAEEKGDDIEYVKSQKSENEIKPAVEPKETLPKSGNMKNNTEKDLHPKPFGSKDIILGVINILSVILTLVILSKIPLKADELKNIKTDIYSHESKTDVNIFKVDQYEEKYDKLSELFLDEAGVVDFVNEVEALKGENTAIQKITFLSQIPLKDKTGNMGYTASIEFKGSWAQIASDLEKVGKLSYLTRPVSFKSKYNEKENLIELSYGIILYVKD